MYYVLEEDKGLIGDFYVRRRYSGSGAGEPLLIGCAGADHEQPAVQPDRIAAHDAAARAGRRCRARDCRASIERNFMRIDLAARRLAQGRVRRPMYIEKWNGPLSGPGRAADRARHMRATSIAASTTSTEPGGARRFLHNIVQYPGCGAFYRPASIRGVRRAPAGCAAFRWPASWRRTRAISRRSVSRRTCAARG